MVGWLVGAAWLGLAGAILLPLALALWSGEPWQPFAIAAAVAAAGGALLLFALRSPERALEPRSAFLAVTAIWVSICGLGALPFALHTDPALPLADALFESTSGFTTTGATVLTGLDALPRSLLLWRSISQWLGGMGVVILGVAILPLLGVGGMQIYRAEAPGPTKDKLTPRIAETARLLWVLYVGMSLLAGVLYAAAGMGAFDAVCHAMTTVATGGFSTHDASLGFYDSGVIHLIAIVFMIAGGTSFAILHRALTGGLAWSNQPELRAYIGMIGLAAAVIAFDLLRHMRLDFVSSAEVLEHSLFQAVSIATTTGYSTRDYGQWPALSQTTLFTLFFIGGMAGSTAGGVKVIRIVLLARLAFAQFFRLLHPKGVHVVRFGARTLDDQVLVSAVGFVCTWLLLLGTGAALLSLYGTDFSTSVVVSAVTLGNIGPGLGAVGPLRSYAAYDDGAKLVMSALMILGRLEIYTVLIILTPGFWRR